MRIDLTVPHEDLPNQRHVRRLADQLKAVAEQEVDKLATAKFITVSLSQFASPIVLAYQKNKYRFCVDYRILNKYTKRFQFPLPRIPDILKAMAGAKVYSQFDLRQGYNQIALDPSTAWLTTFILHCGQFMYTRVPFGLVNAPAYFQFAMVTIVLAGLVGIFCHVFFDDIALHAATHLEMLDHVRAVLHRLHQYNLTVSAAKCNIARDELESVLGYHLTSEGVKHSTDKLDKVCKFPRPDTKQQLQSFLGLCIYFKNHVRNFSLMRKPFTDLLSATLSKKAPLAWTPALDAQYEQLKESILACPLLYHADSSLELHVETDASAVGIGAFIYQVNSQVKEPLHFVSLAFSDVQKRWKVHEQEAFAPYYAVTSADYLFKMRHFHLHTDHRNFLFMSRAPSTKVTRW
ncbi:MAG: hypothetical protein EBU88_16270, partial [Acidobacteria bacterium]|nr:hypothetical protein [Acidobacteriota bacterium]